MPPCCVLPPVQRNFVSLVLCAAVLSGQPAPSTKPGKVEGVVINSVTNDPVKKATVTLQALQRNANYAAVTDAAGHFHFDSVEPGKYQALATRDGFIPPQGGQRNPWAKPIAVAEEQQVKDLVVKLVPLAVVGGHVFDEDGDPVARAQVQALRYVYRQGAKQLNPAGFATTNDLGEYQLLDLEPGRYYFLAAVQPLLARLPPHTRNASPEQTYPDTFYPSALQADQATASQIAPGAQLTGIDFRVHRVPAHRIRGKAVDGRTGQPIRNAMIRIQTRGSVFFERAQIQQDGTFEARGVVSGSYLLICQTQEEVSSRQALDVGDHDVDDVVLVLRPPFEIRGTVRLEGDPPPAEHRGPMRVGLISTEMGPSAQVAVNADGSFALMVTPGVYQINASCDAGAYLKSMHFADQDVTSGKIDFTQQSSGALNIVCGTDVGQIQGSVQSESGEPAGEAMITVVPEGEHEGRQDLFFQLISGENGKFEYRDFAPGDYKVFAWETPEADPNMLRSAEFRKTFEGRAASVSISPGGKASVQLKLIPAADIEAEKNKLP